MTEMTEDKAAALRKPFPKTSIGQLPKAGMMLDYVGHAATTDRLLAVDPAWTWRHFTTEEILSLPPSLREGGLWIHLTVCGVTRPGVGDGKSAKECIGDAIRNAAMRFGVALDLWSKEELEGAHGEAEKPDRRAERLPATPADDQWYTAPPIAPEDPTPITTKTNAHMHVLFGRKGVLEDEQLPGVNHILGTDYTSRKQITEAQAKRVIAVLNKRPDVDAPAKDEAP